jgi:site-specific DNA-methyltransferase (adenine-specific)
VIDIRQGDMLDVLPGLAADSVSACVTDPPYELGFMGRSWDRGGVAFDPETWRAVLRVLCPGGHLLAFGGTRTSHRMVCAIEDAGFEIRDTLCWLYGSGFPKSRNLGEGWGTALKPAWEPIIMARKPLSEGTVAGNVLRHGTGGINVDACRVAGTPEPTRFDPKKHGHDGYRMTATGAECAAAASPLGRWPANVVHDGSPEVEAAFAAFGQRDGAVSNGKSGVRGIAHEGYGKMDQAPSFNDTGTASRFFYSAKASASDRASSRHPTVKPVALMGWLVRLVTPPGGVVLDPFAGSGTTGEAAKLGGFGAILIEREAEYVADIRRRMDRWHGGDLPLFVR